MTDQDYKDLAARIEKAKSRSKREYSNLNKSADRLRTARKRHRDGKIGISAVVRLEEAYAATHDRALNARREVLMISAEMIWKYHADQMHKDVDTLLHQIDTTGETKCKPPLAPRS